MKKIKYAVFGIFAASLLFCVKTDVSAHTDNQQNAVTVLANNTSAGAVFSTKNGQSFTHYTYCDATDSVTVTALPVNKEFKFKYYTDNGAIIDNGNSEQYTFNIGGKNHRVVAVFERFKGHSYKTDENISGITRNENAVDYVKEYKVIGVSLNAKLTTIDEGTKQAAAIVSGENYSSAFDFQLSSEDGKLISSLKQPTRVCLKLPKSEIAAGRTFHVICANGMAPVLLPDLDTSDLTVTFELQQSAIYVLTYSDTVGSPSAIIPTTKGPLIPLS